jgi:tetratricopeptide (TPR) repeat protein
VITTLLTTAAPSYAQSQAQPGAHSDPGPAEVYHPALVSYRIAYYYQFTGDQQQAIAKFTEAIDLLPTYAYTYAARGDSYVLIGDYQAAIDDYTVAIGIYPDYVSALKTRGNAYVAIGEYELALADFNNAITQMPTYADAYRAAGDMYMLRGDIDEANKWYRSYAQYTSDTLDS